MRESQGFLLLLLLLLPLLMDSYKMMYLHAQYENELLFNRLIANAAVFSGKSGMAIMADMGVFCLIDRIAQLGGAAEGLKFQSGEGSAAIPPEGF